MNENTISPLVPGMQQPYQGGSIVGPWRKDNFITRLEKQHESARRAEETRKELQVIFGEYLNTDQQKID